MTNNEGWVQDKRISPVTNVLLILMDSEPQTQAKVFPFPSVFLLHDAKALVASPQEAGGSWLESLLASQHVMRDDGEGCGNGRWPNLCDSSYES